MKNIKLDKDAAISIVLLSFFLSIGVLSVLKQVLSHYGFDFMRHSVIPLAIFAVTMLYAYLRKGVDRYYLVIIAVVFIACLQSSFFPDESWDGLAYHQKAAWFYMHGGNLMYDLTGAAGNYWTTFYPKATWYFAGETGVLFGHLNYGSSYQFILGGALFFYVKYFFSEFKYNKFAGLAFGVFSVFSPIFLAQAFSFYVDAVMGYLSFLLMLSAVAYVNNNKVSDLAVIVVASVIIVNIKFSGFLYVAAAFLLIGIFSLKSFNRCIVVGGAFLLFVVAGIGVLGNSPYVKNMETGHHIFHPIFGKEKRDIITFQSPSGFSDLNRFEKLAISLFSRSENIDKKYGKEPELKMPGTVFPQEIASLRDEDLRIGGFGPLFSLALVISVLFLLLRCGIDKNVLMLLAMTAFSTVLNPEAWWARYAPHLYIIPLLPLFVSTNVRLRYLNYIVLPLITLILGINAYLIAKERVIESKYFLDNVISIKESCQHGTLEVSAIQGLIVDQIFLNSPNPIVVVNERDSSATDFPDNKRRRFSYRCIH
ncbi:hypothetical protein [Pantoea sp. B65]|uniref:hypothetical protein n=1 Tax=Pantoea sp. B65 TaxID=2813359 RepID=UPI0039B58ED4